MIIALVLLLLVLGSVVFQWLTPWTLTPLASNWHQIDFMLGLTLAVTGLFFVVINLFVAYTVWRFRHRPGVMVTPRVEDHAHNKRLERGLVGATTLGIVALLAPGLATYANYVSPPADAMLLEVVAQQWQWHFRFAGAGGRLGSSDVRFVSGSNPLGLNPNDPAGQDDVIVEGGEVHLPLGQPVKILLRSHDVLHDFFVPPMRARLNIVPGQVGSFWFTPTVAGHYEAMCAQLCGLGHPAMRGMVVVEDRAAFERWLASQPRFADTQKPAGS
jgi:cytochrome c oxidase subunit 2